MEIHSHSTNRYAKLMAYLKDKDIGHFKLTTAEKLTHLEMQMRVTRYFSTDNLKNMS